jgi:hypothetical protein
MMNRDALLAGAPKDAQWRAMPPVDQLKAVVNLAIATLDACHAAGRDLDAWEAYKLRSALGAIYTNFLALAFNEVVLALAPPEERSPEWVARLPTDIPKINQWRDAFERARHCPVSAG